MIKVGDIGVLRALEPDLDWLYTIETMRLWHLGISKEPWSKAVLASYIDAQPGNLLRDGQLRLVFEVDGAAVGAVDVYDYDAIARKGGIGIVLRPEARGKAKAALEAFSNTSLERWACGCFTLLCRNLTLLLRRYLNPFSSNNQAYSSIGL